MIFLVQQRLHALLLLLVAAATTAEIINVPSLTRLLAVGDFDGFNEAIKDVTLTLGDLPRLGEGLLSIELRNVTCTNMNIGDISSGYEYVPSDTGIDELTLQTKVSPFSLDCYADYSYVFTIFRGSGTLSAQSRGNDVSMMLGFQSPSFELQPPNASSVKDCLATIDISQVDMSNGLEAIIVALFQDLVADAIGTEAGKALCNDASEIFSFLDSILETANSALDTLMAPPATPDILAKESELDPTLELIKLNTGGGEFGSLAREVLNEAEALLGEEISDGSQNGTDLGINVWLRENVLDEEGVLSLPLNMKMVSSHDQLTQMDITLESIRVTGLDTFSVFSPIEGVGNYTLTHSVNWRYLAMEMVVLADMKSSSLPEALILSSEPLHNIETIRIAVDVTEVDVELALMIAANLAKLRDTPIGNLLFLDTIVPCLMETMAAVDFSNMNVTVGDMGTLEVDGFTSPGFDRLFKSMIKAAFTMYKPSLLRAIPGAFAGPVRDFTKSGLIDPLMEGGDCIPREVTAPFVDFRDLMLQEDESVALGGSGGSPFGTILPTVRSMLTDRMKFVEVDGLPGINSVLVRPITRQQSGVDGSLVMQQDLARIAVALGSDSFQMEMTIKNLRIENLDTITLPLNLVDPTDEAQVLNNMINLGMDNVPLDLALSVGLRTDGQFFPKSGGYDELEIRTTVNSLNLVADLSALIATRSLLSFQLRDVFSLDCWMAMFHESQQTRTDGANSLTFEQFTATLTSLNLTVTCPNCPGPGAAILPDMMSTLLKPATTDMIAKRLAKVVGSVAEGNTVSTWLSSMTEDAPRHCPSHILYDESATRTGGTLGFPEMSAEGVDLLLYGAIVTGWSGLVSLSQGHEDFSLPSMEPLSAQASFVAPPEAEMVDWTDLSGTTPIGALADQAWVQANQILTERSTDGEIGINSFLRDFLGAGAAIDTVPEGFQFQMDDFVFSVDRIRASGLDSFTDFSGVQAIGPQTLQMTMALTGLDVELEVSAYYLSTPESKQTLTLSFGVDQVAMEVAMFAAFDVAKLGKLNIGSLLRLGDIIPCVLSTAEQFRIPSLKISLDSFKGPTVEGLLDETAESASAFLSVTSEAYMDTIVAALPKFVEGPVRDVVESMLQSETSERFCNKLDSKSTTGFVDFRDLLRPASESQNLGGAGDGRYGDIVPELWSYIRSNFLAIESETGLSKINSALIDPLTQSQSGVEGALYATEALVDERLYFGLLDALITMRVTDAYVEGLNTMGSPFSLVSPADTEAHVLKNLATVGVGQPLRLGAEIFFGLRGEDSNIRNRFNVEIEMDSFSLLLDALIKVEENAFLDFQIQDIMNVDCWLATLPSPIVDERGVREQTSDNPFTFLNVTTFYDSLKLSIDCESCSSPDFPELTERLSTPEGAKSGAAFADSILDIAMEFIGGDFMYLTIDRMLVNARTRCPHREEYQPSVATGGFKPFQPIKRPDNFAFFLKVLMGVSCFLIAISLFLVTVRVIVRRRHRRWLTSLPHYKVMALWQHQQKENNAQIEVNTTSSSLFRSPSIPLPVRLLIPVIIVGNIGLFLSGHLSPAASMTGVISMAGETFSANDVFEFSLANGMVSVWKAGGVELAILIFLFSGLWPYLKQVISLTLWFLPPSLVTCERRLNLYLWLDFLAKWSMVDIFTLLISLVAFRISAVSPELDFLPMNFYTIELLVIPKLGLYNNFIAQVVSQISSHFIIYYDRKTVRMAKEDIGRAAEVLDLTSSEASSEEAKERKDDKFDNAKRSSPEEHKQPPVEESLATHAYARLHRGDKDGVVPHRVVAPLVVLTVVASFATVIAGCSLPSFSSEIMGIFGLIVESGEEFNRQAISGFSLFDMVTVLFKQARLNNLAKDYLGLGSLGALLVSTVLVVPLLQATLLVVHWFVPFSRVWRKRVIVVNEILQAWQYTEVFVLSVMAGAWQLGSVSHFMVNIYCNHLTELKSLMAQLVYFGMMKGEDAQCFLVEAAPVSGFFVLAAGSMLMALLNSYISKAALHYMHDKEGAAPKQVTNVDEAIVLDSALDLINPAPVMFTDRFRWFMRREHAYPSELESCEEPTDVNASRTLPKDPKPVINSAYNYNNVMEADSDDDDTHLYLEGGTKTCLTPDTVPSMHLD